MGTSFNKRFIKVWPVLRRLVFSFVTILLLTGCDRTFKCKPFHFPNTIWVNTEIKACFVTTENHSFLYGEIMQKDEILPVTFVCYTGSSGAILDYSKAYSDETIWEEGVTNDKYLWAGVVNYEQQKFVLERTDDGKYKGDGPYPLSLDEKLPLTFERYDYTVDDLKSFVPWNEDGSFKESFQPGQLLEFGLSAAEENGSTKTVWDFWPDPFGVSDRGTSDPELDAS